MFCFVDQGELDFEIHVSTCTIVGVENNIFLKIVQYFGIFYFYLTIVRYLWQWEFLKHPNHKLQRITLF